MECKVCGRLTTLMIGDIPICEQCYEHAGSCCMEFGDDDLWQRRPNDCHEIQSTRTCPMTKSENLTRKVNGFQ